jgi:hypothetical protein
MAPFRWDESGPSPEAWAALQSAEDGDFPETYSGIAWRAAYRLLKVAKEDPTRFASWDGWTSDPIAREAVKGLDLTGFMFGWAINALRAMMEMPAVRDGATVIVGGGEDQRGTELVPTGPAKADLRLVLGGKN